MNRRNFIKTAGAILLTTGASQLAGASGKSSKPNIVFFFIDDMGYGDIGPFGSTINKTPHLDRMAKEGIKLTSFYVSATACTPSRSVLMTGCYADRIGMDGGVVFPGDKRGLHPDEITIAEMLKENGYATGCFGKWHLGDNPKFMPDKQGFDTYTGIPYSNDMWPGKKNRAPLPFIKDHKVVAHISDGKSQAVLGDAIIDAAVDFIKQHKDEPFLAYIPHSMVHNPRYVLKERGEKAKGNNLTKPQIALKAQIEEIDTSVGRVMKTLEDMGIAGNTLVFFTSDNGGGSSTSMGPLSGGKSSHKWEGHMRACTVAWWPGKIPAGIVTDEIGATIDILPTLAKLTGANVPKDRIIDGKDISNLLLKPGSKSPHDVLFYEYEGVRQSKWKLVRILKRKKGKGQTSPGDKLFDLDADIGEKNDIADKYPDKLKELQGLLDAHTKEVQSNHRPAAFVEDPKPLPTEGLPTLVEYLGLGEVEIFETDTSVKKRNKTKRK